MDEQQDRKTKPATRPTRPGRASRGKKEDFFIVIDDKFMKNRVPDMEKIIITDPEKKAKGGRVGLRGGGICKRGMNRQAIGKNS